MKLADVFRMAYERAKTLVADAQSAPAEHRARLDAEERAQKAEQDLKVCLAKLSETYETIDELRAELAGEPQP